MALNLPIDSDELNDLWSKVELVDDALRTFDNSRLFKIIEFNQNRDK